LKLTTGTYFMAVAPAAFLSLASAGSTLSGSFFAKDVDVAPRITVRH